MVHKLGVREHEKSLIARIMLKPKVDPMTSAALRDSINEMWKITGYWKFLSMGRSFYSIHITNYLERDCILTRRIWQFKYGTVKLQRWTPEFNTY